MRLAGFADGQFNGRFGIAIGKQVSKGRSFLEIHKRTEAESAAFCERQNNAIALTAQPESMPAP